MDGFSRLVQKVQGRWRRDAARLLDARHFSMRAGPPIISFSFDDFPQSALTNGGTILKKFAISGTYYASLGLMGQKAPTGEIFSAEDLTRLLAQGHELGCHTFSHCHAWDTPPDTFEKSVLENGESLKRLQAGVKFASLSYPIASPRPATKRRMSKHFKCCRGGGQAFNIGQIDLNLLSAYFLEQSRDNPAAIKATIDQNNREGGWLIFATHDVCERPTRFGCSPTFFESIVSYAAHSGATLLNVSLGLEAIQLRRS